MRRTLWLATPEVTRQMHAAATRKLIAPERNRLLEAARGQRDVADPERLARRCPRPDPGHLHEHGPTSARDLGRRCRRCASR